MVTYPTLPNPTGVGQDLVPVVNAIQVTAVTLAVVAAVHAVASLAWRYRSGDTVGRAQLRWILLASMITVLAAIPFLMTRYLIDVGNALGEVAALGVQLAMSTFPLAAALAISRYRLYDVDLLIGRTLVYVPLMAILGGLYTAGIAVFQRLFVAFTGKTSDVAIILTALLVASIFTPLRKVLEGALERRFPMRSETTRAAEPGPPPAVEHEVLPARAARQPVAEAVSLARVLPIRGEDKVDCPVRGHEVLLGTCLGCPKLLAISRSPEPAVICTGAAAQG
jgi:hypothetical protein